MKYLCLVYRDMQVIDNLPAPEFNAIIDEVQEYLTELRTHGNYIDASPLQPPDTAVTMQVRGGKLSITDGPFVETREQLAGYYLIEADDLNDAIRVAAKSPSASHGSIEVRPIRELSPR